MVACGGEFPYLGCQPVCLSEDKVRRVYFDVLHTEGFGKADTHHFGMYKFGWPLKR